ncbi:MAG: 4Fe-4S dicluster domain-containing protein [Bacteroidia bacterium]
MAIKITDDCINCGACEIKCPNKAIYEGGKNWSFSYGAADSRFLMQNGKIVGSEDPLPPLSEKVYYIATEKCTECVGFHDEPQCASVCPVDCCIPDKDNKETHDQLTVKKQSKLVR